MRRESVAWRLDSILGTGGSARQVQTDLERGFGHAGVGNWGTLGSVVLRVECERALGRPRDARCHVPLVQLQLVACRYWVSAVVLAAVSQSVTTCLCAGLASRLAVWQVSGLCVCVCVCAYEDRLYIHDWDSWFHKDGFWFSFQLQWIRRIIGAAACALPTHTPEVSGSNLPPECLNKVLVWFDYEDKRESVPLNYCNNSRGIKLYFFINLKCFQATWKLEMKSWFSQLFKISFQNKTWSAFQQTSQHALFRWKYCWPWFRLVLNSVFSPWQAKIQRSSKYDVVSLLDWCWNKVSPITAAAAVTCSDKVDIIR